jgi:MFS family permease
MSDVSIATRLVAGVAGLPRPFWILWTGTLVNRLGSFVVPFLSLYLTKSRGWSVAEAGLVVSLFGLGLIGAGPLGGVIADRIGRRAAILVGLGAGGACAIALGCADRLETIAVCTFLLALLGETYRPGVQAMVADLVPPVDRPRAFGLIYWAINLGFAVAMSVAGVFADRGLQLLFFIDGITSLVFAAVVLVGVPETRPPPTKRGDGRLGGFAAALGDRVFVWFLLSTFALVVIFWQHQVTLPVDITNHGVSPAGYGRLIAINGVLIVLLQPFAATLLGRFDRTRVLGGACLLVGLGFGINALADTAAVFGLSIAVWTLGEIAYFPTAAALVADLAPASMRGRYQGINGMTSGLAAVAAPITGGFVLEQAGRSAVWGGCLALGAVAAALQFRLRTPLRLRLLGLPTGD